MDLKQKVWAGMTWVHKEKCWALLKTVMNLLVAYSVEISLTN